MARPKHTHFLLKDEEGTIKYIFSSEGRLSIFQYIQESSSSCSFLSFLCWNRGRAVHDLQMDGDLPPGFPKAVLF